MLGTDERAVAAALPYPALIEAVEAAFRAGAVMPPRHHHTMASPTGEPTTLLLMPCWQAGGRFGIKVVTVSPANANRGLPTVQAVYLLGDVATGAFAAALDASELTLRRTAATSALASRHLSRPDARRLLMVGSGQLAPHLVRAHCLVRPIRQVQVWGRSAERAAALAARLAPEIGSDVTPVADLDEAVTAADIISCATLSTVPLVRGECLRAGQHLDLVGAFLPTMRETDDEAVRRASLFVDSRSAALLEAGDLTAPLTNGAIRREDIRADLSELVQGRHPGRETSAEITLFKSVGLALEDLAAAALVIKRGLADARA